MDDKERTTFQNTMLQYVHPTPGWVEPDNSGLLRWGYEILPEKVEACLTYLYQFVPYDAMQMIALLVHKGGLSLDKATSTVMALRRGETFKAETPLATRENDKILVAGPFSGLSIKEFHESNLPDWVHNIVTQYESAQELKGPVPVDGEPNWKTTLPTQGVYSDLAIGICSGGEDYYEIQRQFDLELKKMEIEKLKLEVEKLKIVNDLLEQGKSATSVVIKDPTDKTAINLDLSVGQGSAVVEVQP